MGDTCEVCKTEIKMMVRRGTGICSENCEKLKNLPVNTYPKETS